MRLTIIISYYKALDNLKVILKSLNHQSSKNFEVIISEDDNNEETIQFVVNYSHLYNFPIHHLYQKEDLGFRKNKMLNRSVAYCKTELLAFIDGDCVPHKHFVKEYVKNIKEGIFLSGRCVFLGNKTSNTLLVKHSLLRLNYFLLIVSDSKKVKEGIYLPLLSLSYKDSRGLVGRNWGILRKHLLEINGFDEDYVGAGAGEDSDIQWRLLANGLIRKSAKNKAIVFHLFHPRTYSTEGVKKNLELLKSKKLAGNIRCTNGISNLTTKI